jgi:hypothetical protein
MYSLTSSEFAHDVNTIKQQINIAYKDLGLIDSDMAARLLDFLVEAESLPHSDSPSLVMDKVRQELEKTQNWTISEFFDTYTFGPEDSKIDKAISVAGSSLFDVFNAGPDISDVKCDECIDRFLVGICASIYSVVAEATKPYVANDNIEASLAVIC